MIGVDRSRVCAYTRDQLLVFLAEFFALGSVARRRLSVWLGFVVSGR